MLRLLTLTTLFPDASRPNFGIFVEQQARALSDRADIEQIIVAARGIPPWPLYTLDRYRKLAALPESETWRGMPVRRPKFLNLPGTGGRYHARMLARAVSPLLAEIHRDFPFDLIAAEFFYPGGPAAVALGRRFGVPVSIKARGSDIHYWGHAPATAGQVLDAANRADGLLAVSQAMRDDMIALGMPAERIGITTTGIDSARFHIRDRAAEKRALGVEGPLVVSIGALIPIKGHDILIDAIAQLPGVSLLIAGIGPEQAALQRQIDQAGLGDRIRLLGAVPHDRLGAIVGAADVMALASEREGLANAWVEALASGTPIVIPDVGGARQLLPDGISPSGRLVARSSAAFAQGIAAILADPPDPESVRAPVADWTWAANAARLSKHYHALVESHRESGARSAA